MHQPTHRVIKVLECLRNCELGMNITQLSKECNISVGTLHPIVQTLCELGYLENDNKVYKITYKMNSEIENKKTIKIIIYHMDKLAKEQKVAVQLGILSGRNVIYIHKSDGDENISLKTKAGDIAAINTTALGKALLLNKSYNEIKDFFKNQKLVKNTDKTITDVDLFCQNLEEYKNTMVTMEKGEFNEDFACLATPIYKQGKIFAAISVTVLIFHLSNEKIIEISKALLRYKNIIEKEINH